MKVFIGWDAREDIAYEVLKNSILRQTKNKVEIEPIKHRKLREKGLFRRPWLAEAETGFWRDLIDDKHFATEFSHTRFLVPKLMNYKGVALFLDCDMLFTSDIAKLFNKFDPALAVQVVKHNHAPKEATKMDGMPQERYYRKNWSSFMLFNCGHPKNKKLTPEYVSIAKGSELHQFKWLDDGDIGHLGCEHNWIEGSSPTNIKPASIHYTGGGPWLKDEHGRPIKDVAYADLWEAEYHRYQRDSAYLVPTTIPQVVDAL